LAPTHQGSGFERTRLRRVPALFGVLPRRFAVLRTWRRHTRAEDSNAPGFAVCRPCSAPHLVAPRQVHSEVRIPRPCPVTDADPSGQSIRTALGCANRRPASARHLAAPLAVHSEVRIPRFVPTKKMGAIRPPFSWSGREDSNLRPSAPKVFLRPARWG